MGPRDQLAYPRPFPQLSRPDAQDHRRDHLTDLDVPRDYVETQETDCPENEQHQKNSQSIELSSEVFVAAFV